MNPAMTYHQQLKRGRKVGWAHADSDSMLAAVAGILADLNAMNPEVIYDWAVKHGHDYLTLRDRVAFRKIPDWQLLEAVLNGTPLEDS